MLQRKALEGRGGFQGSSSRMAVQRALLIGDSVLQSQPPDMGMDRKEEHQFHGFLPPWFPPSTRLPQWLGQPTLGLLQHGVLWVGAQPTTTWGPLGHQRMTAVLPSSETWRARRRVPILSLFLFICLESLLPNPEPKAVGRAGDVSPFQGRLDPENPLTRRSASTVLHV